MSCLTQPEKSGLHFHGLNETTKNFVTMPQNIVDAFANEWGFIVTTSLTLDTILQVRSFTEDIAKAGMWNGEPLEGFVVRATISHLPINDRNGTSAPPYPRGSSFFLQDQVRRALI